MKIFIVIVENILMLGLKKVFKKNMSLSKVKKISPHYMT
jgi:hypothetical protein